VLISKQEGAKERYEHESVHAHSLFYAPALPNVAGFRWLLDRRAALATFLIGASFRPLSEYAVEE
jgi:hypothetical protein